MLYHVLINTVQKNHALMAFVLILFLVATVATVTSMLKAIDLDISLRSTVKITALSL